MRFESITTLGSYSSIQCSGKHLNCQFKIWGHDTYLSSLACGPGLFFLKIRPKRFSAISRKPSVPNGLPVRSWRESASVPWDCAAVK